MNKLYIKISADIANDAFIRSTVAAFCVELDPTVEQIEDIKTAVSEAFTNCVIHGYEGKSGNYVYLDLCVDGGKLSIIISDGGKGIENVQQALEPFFTTKPDEERSGMGFTLMSTFMDEMRVDSAPGKGTTVTMIKNIGKEVA